MSTLTYGSLFTGIGGLESGLVGGTGGSIKWTSEISEFPSTLNTYRNVGDITTFYPEAEDYVDVVCGGFPCQNISTAGNKAGISGEKSSLFYEMIRVCESIKPQYFVLENSTQIKSRGLDVVLKEIERIGYDAIWFDLSAKRTGAPQRRNRWFCIANRLGNSNSLRKLQQEGRISNIGRWFDHADQEMASHWESKSIVGSTINGVPIPYVFPLAQGLEQLPYEVNRTVESPVNMSNIMKVLGNAVVPQVAFYVGLVLAEMIKYDESIGV